MVLLINCLFCKDCHVLRFGQMCDFLNIVSSFFILLGLICLVSFAIGLIFTMGSGNYWLEIFNSYVGSLPLLVVAFFEIVAVVYVYGMQRYLFTGLLHHSIVTIVSFSDVKLLIHVFILRSLPSNTMAPICNDVIMK